MLTLRTSTCSHFAINTRSTQCRPRLAHRSIKTKQKTKYRLPPSVEYGKLMTSPPPWSTTLSSALGFFVLRSSGKRHPNRYHESPGSSVSPSAAKPGELA